MARTYAEMDRLEMEFAAIDAARDDLHYLGYRPPNDTWKSHCEAFKHKLLEKLNRGEYFLMHP